MLNYGVYEKLDHELEYHKKMRSFIYIITATLFFLVSNLTTGELLLFDHHKKIVWGLDVKAAPQRITSISNKPPATAKTHDTNIKTDLPLKHGSKINHTSTPESRVSNQISKETLENIVCQQENLESAINIENTYATDGQKIAFLTFDDGPTPHVTPAVLKILNKYHIKATFFVLGMLAEQNPELIRQEYIAGHAIGNHTYSHKFDNIYYSVDHFMEEIRKTDNVLKNILGINFNTRIVRLPGGSFGENRTPFTTALSNSGYHYIDWNALNGDAEGHNIPVAQLIEKTIKSIQGKDHVVILMHDAATKQTTVQALPHIIEYLQQQDYEFKTLY